MERVFIGGMKKSKLSRKEQVYHTIRDRILSQEYAIGSKLNIRALSSELKVSNTPVREALSMLEMDGLVSFRPNTGFQVFQLSKEEVTSIEETMSVLLIGGYALCLQQEKIPDLIHQMEARLEMQKKTIYKGSSMEIAKAAIAFDEVFFSVLNNKELIRLYQTILDKMILLIFYDHTRGNSNLFAEFHEHEQILKAVKGGNSDQVMELIVQHFSRAVPIK